MRRARLTECELVHIFWLKSSRDFRNCDGFRTPAHLGPCHALWGRRPKTAKERNRGRGREVEPGPLSLWGFEVGSRADEDAGGWARSKPGDRGWARTRVRVADEWRSA